MRIGILVHYFPVRSQTFIVDHAAELLRRGHEVVVIPLVSVPNEAWDAPAAVRSLVDATAPSPGPRRRSRNPFEGAGIVARALLRARYDEIRFACERDGAPRGLRHRLLLAQRAASSGPFDVLHVQFAWAAPSGIALARRGIVDAPVLCSIHGQDANVTGRQHPGWIAAIGRQVSAMTVGSTYMHDVVAAEGVAPEKVHVWHQGVDVDRVVDHVAPRPGELRVLSVGRLVEFKGFDDSLRVIAAARARIPGLRYTVVGDGPERASLESLARALGVHDITTFAGARNHDEVLAQHARSDVYLQMGKRGADGSIEGQGVAPCEASASGLPCVATRSGGLTDVVADGASGVLVAMGDVDAAADALVRLARDDAYRGSLGEGARRYMRERFSLAASTDRIEAIYREAISRHR